ncbi:LolA-like protein [Streptacidiphilus fuscans]|uniref:LppX_LprAFG lipoprotein n=1 Tax=Streptacidiphilus fuscans TaxID=2789292 RepID=A0A931B3G1_9ACTN|nr:hypothetical protein [Streptacidiphilus fuscans]MBF9067947.1 hypothetical protein [Streptacidiphilus fuscans]
MRHIRTLVAATSVALALVGVSACSAAKQVAAGAAAPLVSVADAMSLTTKATQQFSSAHVSMTEHISAKGKSMALTGSGALSWKPLAMDMTMNSSQFSQLGTDSVHMLMSGTTMYMNVGDTGAAQLGGKHWMKMDFTELGAAGKAMAEQMDKSSGNDPSTQIKLFTSSGDIHRVGTATVDGVQTTHYAGTVELAKLANSQDANIRSVLAQDTQLGLTSINVDLWVDGQNRPVRVHQTTSPGAAVGFDIQVDYADFSTSPVTVTPPSASDTVDFAQLVKGLNA